MDFCFNHEVPKEPMKDFKISSLKTDQIILLTIDVEDWFQVENLRSWFPVDTWEKQHSRVEQNTHRLLDLFDSVKLSDDSNPKATFFVLGWIAKRFPNLIGSIQNRGHEVASHGFNHLMCNQIDSRELEQDLIQSKKVLEDLVGCEVKGYRAPNFSINDIALELIQRVGYRYDSSYNDFSRHGRYGTISHGWKNTPETALRINKQLIELKISNLHIANQTIPWGGGGYFRLLPPLIFNFGVRKILSSKQVYMFYIHPWEIDPQQPKIDANKLATWRHYLNLDRTYRRLETFLKTFNQRQFITCNQYIERKVAAHSLTVG